MIKNTNPRIKTLTKKLLMAGKKLNIASIAISEFINGFNNHDNYYSTKSSLLRKGNYVLSTTIKNNRPLVGVSNTLNNNYSSLLAPHEKFVSSKSETKEVLNPLEFEQWTREQVCSLLCMDDENGGANLDIKKVNQLYNVGFDGAYLGNLVKNSVFECHKDFPEIPTSTIIAVENWVKDLLKTKLYQVWPVEKVREILCVRAVCGGVGLSSSQAKPFIDAKVSGLELKKLYQQVKSSNELEKEDLIRILAECGISYTPQIETSCQMLIKWISSLQLAYNPVFKLYEPQIKIEKLFTNEELLFLGKVEDLDLESLEKPNNADAFMFDLKNREECCTIVSSIVRRNSHVEFKDTKLIYFNFTNGFNLENNERDNNYLAMISSRLVYSAFKYPEYVARSIPVSCGIHVLHELFYIISKKIHEKENVGMNVTIPIVLVLDEFQKAIREIPSFGTNLKQALSWYIATLQKQHGLLIIPVFGGTLTNTDIEFLQTDNESSAVLLPLPCLREQDIDSIISDLPSVVPYYKDRFKLIWNVIGCVPRHLEWTINHPRMTGTENLTIPQESVMNEVYMDLSQQVLRLYSKLNFGMEEIAMICLSGLPMNRFETNQYLNYFPIGFSNQILSLEQKGLLYGQNNKLQLPLVVLDQLQQDSDNLIQKLMSDKSEWQKLQELTLQTLSCRFNVVFCCRNQFQINVNLLFCGAKYHASLENVIVKVNPLIRKFKCGDSDKSLSNVATTDFLFYKTKRETIQGISCNVTFDFGYKQEEAIILVHTKLNDDLTPLKIAKLYSKALNIESPTLNQKEKYIFMVTNKRITEEISRMIEKGVLEFTINKKPQQLQCQKLIMVDRGNFSDFFNAFIAQFI